MTETKRSPWAFSWLIGGILMVAAALLLLGPSAFGNGGVWESIATAELLACLSGIAFSWYVIRLMRGSQRIPESSTSTGVQAEGQKTVQRRPGTQQNAVRSNAEADLSKSKVDDAKQESEPTSPVKLFATRAARIQARTEVLKRTSTSHRAMQLAVAAAKARATQEGVAAQQRATKAARDISLEAHQIADRVIQRFTQMPKPKSVREAADSAAQAAQQLFEDQELEWTGAHAAQLKEILAQLDHSKVHEDFVRLAQVSARKQPRPVDDSETAATALAEAIGRALGQPLG